MIGMNQFFYTFKNGNLYRHNTNNNYNTYYGDTYPSTITSIFNEAPLENKIFKTLNLESDESWDAVLTSDIQTTGVISEQWFEKKEYAWFAFVRSDGPTGANTDESQFELRSLNGISRSTSVGGAAAAYEINFALTINIGSIVSVGDYLYYAIPPYEVPIFAGQIIGINVNKVNGVNQLVVNSVQDQQGDAFTPPATNPIPIQDAYFLYIKNPIAESHGILGHYCEFTLTLPVGKATNPTELFAVESEVMKSFP
tara:strand:- start:5414 stop:6175 length:762 start_codon:yes stop_codon:yes gene_type:complete